MDDFFASVSNTKSTKPDPARFRGKQITLPRTAKELRYYVRKDTRQLKCATYTDMPVRNGYSKSRIKWCVQYGDATLTPYLIRKFARHSDYNVSKFKKQLEEYLMRKVSTSEAYEFVCNAGKHRNSETIAGKRIEIDKRAKVYTR